MLVAADESADDPDLQALRGFDDAAEMVIRGLARGTVGVEVVRVVGERGDLEVVAREQLANGLGVEVLDVDVTHPGITAPLARARRPACDLERLEGALVRPARDLLQARIGEGGGEQPELQFATPTERRPTSVQRCSRELSATASQTSIASCPSANVG